MKERSSSKNLGSPEGRNSRKREESITNEDEERKLKRRRQSRDSSSSSSSSSCSLSSSDSSSDSDKDGKKKRRSKKDKKKDKKRDKKKMKKEKKRLKKLLKKEKKKLKKEKKKDQGSSAAVREIPESKSPEQRVDEDLETHLLEASRARAPMTKEEWEKQQSVIRRVFDPDTGRHRLVKGTGEILEECVSRERHLAINKAATKGDGDHFQSTIMSKAKDL